ncbi:MAG: pseudouridine synthase, RluA family, partial [Acidimicrobiaceae bacterium]|nr:pseudouridine synthase, RluA family [Acidimicrobiaceae bacterium]
MDDDQATDGDRGTVGDQGTTVPSSLDGERVDRVVAMLTGLPRAEVARLVDEGGVRVQGHAVTSRHRRVVTGELLEIRLPEPSAPERLDTAGAGVIALDVVYEDAAIVVVDKPPGLVVHPGAGHHDDTLAGALVMRYPDLIAAAEAGAGEPLRPGIVHRLDKDTSGLLVVARTPEAFRSLVAQLADRSMGRTYRALALGTLSSEEGVIEAPVGRSERDPTRMAVTTRGREARTRYRVLQRFTEPVDATLLEVHLDTGRTHQIRVHLAAIGHPVVGDARYGGRRRGVAAPRPFLHAERLRLVHPTSGAVLEWAAPLPSDLVGVLALF